MTLLAVDAKRLLMDAERGKLVDDSDLQRLYSEIELLRVTQDELKKEVSSLKGSLTKAKNLIKSLQG